VQDLSIKYTERLTEAGIEPSVGSVCDSYDNALAETINELFKAEVINRRGSWRSFEAVEYAKLEWVDWFNHRRPSRSTISNLLRPNPATMLHSGRAFKTHRRPLGRSRIPLSGELRDASTAISSS
jgi:transposase InsO family protein